MVNPFDSFLIKKEDFKAEDYGMESDGDIDAEIDAQDLDKGWFGLGTYEIPVIKYTPEKIFSNKVPALDVNFISPKKFNDDNMDSKSITQALQETIASWYIALRNLAIVGLLSVLLYVGIRMIISSIASDKAKYKQMFMDWVVALCLLVFLHYIMSFTLTLTEMITDGLDTSDNINVLIKDGSEEIKFKTDLTGLCRIQIQYNDLGVRIIYLIFYMALGVYTVMFTWTYMKRAINMAFLTLIAPVVALTYPIDKMNDGKAQAFNIWLKEYVFNALLQPFHLIIYTIFLGSAMDIAVRNPVYAILFLAFIIPAEKLLRKMFGFDKATTAGAMNSAAGMFGGAAAFKMFSNFVGQKKKSAGGGNNGKNARIREHNKAAQNTSAPSGYDGYLEPSGENKETPKDKDPVLDKYKAEGFEQNANGEYFNPWTDEYDPDYDPHKDKSYAQVTETTQPKPETEKNNSSESNSKSNSKKKEPRIIRGIKNKAGDTLGNKYWWGRQAIKGAKLATRGVTAGAGLAVGLAMGIAGDDLEDVLKFGAAGTALGATVLGDVALDSSRSTFSQVQDIYYGSQEEAELVRQRNRNLFSEDFANDIQKNYKPNGETLHGKDLQAAVERGASYYNNGITDTSQIGKTMKLEDTLVKELETKQKDWTEEKRRAIAKEQATVASKMASKLDDNYLRKNENVRELHASISRGIQSKGLSKNDAERNANEMIKNIKRIKKID